MLQSMGSQRVGHDFTFTFTLIFPGGSDSKAYAYNEGDPGSIPGSGRSPGEGNDNPLKYSCLENPMDRGAWTKKSDMTQQLNDNNNVTPPQCTGREQLLENFRFICDTCLSSHETG